jgi:hypothetical protein
VPQMWNNGRRDVKFAGFAWSLCGNGWGK